MEIGYDHTTNVCTIYDSATKGQGSHIGSRWHVSIVRKVGNNINNIENRVGIKAYSYIIFQHFSSNKSELVFQVFDSRARNNLRSVDSRVVCWMSLALL